MVKERMDSDEYQVHLGPDKRDSHRRAEIFALELVCEHYEPESGH